jgi:hypothetical protein
MFVSSFVSEIRGLPRRCDLVKVVLRMSVVNALVNMSTGLTCLYDSAYLPR